MLEIPSIRTLNQFVRELRKLNDKFFNRLEITLVKEDNLYKVNQVFDVYEFQLMDENANEQTYIHKYELLFEPRTYLKTLKVPKNAEIFFDIEKLITTKFAKIIAKQNEKTVAVLMPIKVDKVTDIIDFHPNKNK